MMADVHEKILHRQLDKVAKDLKYEDYKTKIKPISSEGANYTSVLFLATITAPNKEDLHLFAKVATVGEKMRSQMFVQIFDVENYAYSTLAKIYEKIQDKYEVPQEHRHRMPKFYRFDTTYLEETLVVQDLTAEGYTTHNRMTGMDWAYASKSLEEVAKWHALSIVLQEEYPEEYERATEVVKVNLEDSQQMAATMVQVSTNTIGTITNEEHRERLRKFLDKAGNMEYMMTFLGPMKRPVLTHGDFRMSNIMHKAEGGKMDVVPVDYQCVHVGCGIRDVLFFLLSGTDEEFRGNNFWKLLDHYYESLCAMLRRLNKEPEVLFPRKDFDYEVEKNLPWGILLAMFILPVVTVECENAPKVTEDFDINSILTVQTSSLYETRINGVVSDFVKWGVI